MIFGLPRLYLYGAILAALVAAGVYLRWDATQDAKRALEAAQREHRERTIERVNDATNDPRTPDAIRERLRDLAGE